MNQRISMPLPLPPGPDGLAVDLACPKCTYNLRGLTKPRCPECGFAFRWHDVPELLNAADTGRRGFWFRHQWLAFGLIVALAIVFWPATFAFMAIFLLLAIAISCAWLNARFELLFAGPLLAELRPQFRRYWWEGVVLSYVAAATTCLATWTNPLEFIKDGLFSLDIGKWLMLMGVLGIMAGTQAAAVRVREHKLATSAVRLVLVTWLAKGVSLLILIELGHQIAYA